MLNMDLQSVIIFIVFVSFTNADPTCQTYNEKDIVCSPSTTDYILKRGLVSDNNKTISITLRGCRIADLDYEAFENDHNLEYIDLSLNKIRTLKLGVLDGNPRVTYLNLSYNMITTIPLGLFDQKPNLEVLDLKGNRLSNLELGVFDPLKKITHLDIASNAITGKDLDPYIFDQSKKIRFMDFSRTEMSESSEILLHAFLELDFLKLERCSLKEVPTFVTSPNLKTLKHLVLSTNQITKLANSQTFMNLDNLEILNVAENMIDEISVEVFSSLRRLKMIILRNNRLTTLEDNLFQNLRSLGTLDLSYNMIEYVPVNAFRNTGLRNLNLSHNRFTYLYNSFCLELRNSGVRLKKLFFNDNPWQCACLNEILKEVKLYDIRYNDGKYKGDRAVCVTTKQFNCKRQKSDNDYFVQLYDNNVVTYR